MNSQAQPECDDSKLERYRADSSMMALLRMESTEDARTGSWEQALKAWYSHSSQEEGRRMETFADGQLPPSHPLSGFNDMNTTSLRAREHTQGMMSVAQTNLPKPCNGQSVNHHSS